MENEYGIKTEILKVSEINLNTGQIEGLPKNPRFVKDKDYQDLIQSLKDNPEMKYARELLVIEHENKYVTFAGNTRLRAYRELGIKEVPCKIFSFDFDMKKIRAIALKDNKGYGNWDWDVIANEWDADEAKEWGVSAPEWKDENDIDIPDYSDKNKEIDVNDFGDKMSLTLSFDEDEYHFVTNQLQKHNANKELALLNLLGYDS